MDDKKFDFNDFSRAYFLKKSRAYKKGGYRIAKVLSRDAHHYSSHFFAFLIDINICLFPVYIWVIEFLLIICGLISPNFFDILFYIMFAFLFVTSVLFLGIFTAFTNGQSMGYLLNDLKLVHLDKKEPSGLTLILRQAVGFGIPLMVLGYFFQVAGMLVWWLINGIVVFATPHQQTIADLIFKTVAVFEPDLDIDTEDTLDVLPRSVSKPKKSLPSAQKKTEKPIEKPQVKPRMTPLTEENELTPIDLHIRSNYSDDGYYDIEDIFKQAKEIGMEVISVTDHNCARGNAAAVRFAEMYHIQYIPGVEIDTQFGGTRVRLLGYYIDWENEIFDLIERESLQREKSVSLERAKKFEEYSGIRIDVDSLMSNSRFQVITARDITRMVFNNKRVRELSFVKKYIENASNETQARRRFMADVFGKNGPCYVTAQYPKLADAIEAIHNADGIAILSSWNMDNIPDDEIERMMELGIDGIECFSPRVHQSTMTSLLKIVRSHRAFVTCGSDYHGPNKPNFHLGDTRCPAKALSLVRIITKVLENEEDRKPSSLPRS